MTERLYEKELLLSPLVREGMSIEDIKDFADAIEKVVEGISEIKNWSDSAGGTETIIYDAVKAIDDNVL